MNSEQNIRDVYQTLMDETLLRYLHYNDHTPLSPTKTDVLSLPDKRKVIDKHVIMTPKTSDLEEQSKISRLCMYAGRRVSSSRNYMFANQDIVFDIYVHEDIDLIDLRLSKIRDYINDLYFNEKITGMGKTMFVSGIPITNVPSGYVGYRLIFEFPSENY